MGRIGLSRFFSLRGALAGLLAAAAATVTPLLFAGAPPASATSTGQDPSLVAGVSTGYIGSLSPAQLTSTMQGIAASGARWVRLDVDWPVAEWNPGTLTWSVSDQVVQAALAAGLEVDLIVNGSGPGNVPPWGLTSGGYPNPSAFASFATAVAQHYGPMGIHTYEIWNEPNLAGNWGPSVSPSGYAALLIQAYSAIKAADPQSFVISGGLSPAVDATDGSQISPDTFLAGMYAAGARGHFDAVAVHPYSFPAYPEDPSTASWNTFYNLPNLYQIMVNNGDASKKVWLTEFGAPTGPDVSDGAISEQAQAQMITDAFTQAEQWSWAGALFVYNWQDGTDTTSAYDNFGLVDAAGNPKPALSAFSAAVAGSSVSGSLVSGSSGSGSSGSGSSGSGSSVSGSSGTSGTGSSGTGSSGNVSASSSSPASPPASPNIVRAALRGSTVTLSWTNPTAAQGDNLYRDGTKIASVATASSFWDANVPVGSHTYYVAAFNSAGQGTASKSVTMTITAAFGTFRHSGVIQVVRG